MSARDVRPMQGVLLRILAVGAACYVIGGCFLSAAFLILAGVVSGASNRPPLTPPQTLIFVGAGALLALGPALLVSWLLWRRWMR